MMNRIQEIFLKLSKIKLLYSLVALWIIINSAILISFGIWSYFDGVRSWTSFIPVIFGVGFLFFIWNVILEQKKVLYFIATFALIVGLALIQPLTGSVSRGEWLPIVRIVIMMSSSLLLAIFLMSLFAKWFIYKRKSESQ